MTKPEKHYKAWTRSQIQTLKDLHARGYSDEYIAAHMEREVNAIRGMRWKLRLLSCADPWSEDDTRRVLAAWRAGYSGTVISKFLLNGKRSAQAVRGLARRKGVRNGRGRKTYRVPPGQPGAPHSSWDDIYPPEVKPLSEAPQSGSESP